MFYLLLTYSLIPSVFLILSFYSSFAFGEVIEVKASYHSFQSLGK